MGAKSTAWPRWSCHAQADVATRLVDDRHWASEVTAGAALGIIVGRSVTWHGRNFYATPMFVPKGSGVLINVTP